MIRSGRRNISLNYIYSARYREPAGRQVTATEANGTGELDADSSTRVSVVFAKAKPGGVVTLELEDSKTYDRKAAKIRI
jgi:hypothetical protein